MLTIEEGLARKTTHVATHVNVDVDAATSLALWTILIDKSIVDLQIEFVSAGAKPEDVHPEAVLLDCSNGFKGAESSCFEALLAFAPPDVKQALSLFAEHVTLQDRGQLYKPEVCPKAIQIGTLGATLNAMRRAYHETLAMVTSAGKPPLTVDFMLAVWMASLVRQHLRAGLDRVAAERFVREHGKVLANGRIILLPPSAPEGVSGAAFDLGAQFVVYQDGNNVGIVRASTVEEPNLNELFKDKLPDGFYLDERGFLVCWGSRKAPALEPSPVSAEELATQLETLLAERDAAVPTETTRREALVRKWIKRLREGDLKCVATVIANMELAATEHLCTPS